MDSQVRELVNKMDLNRPGAVEAIEKLTAEGASLAEWRRVADEFAFQFDGGFKPVSDAEHDRALAMLKKSRGGDKATTAIRSGSDVRFGAPARLSWRNANLNWVSGGGIPRARITQTKGQEGIGKTNAWLQAAADVLAMRGKVLWIPLESFDADWARVNNVPVHYSPEECEADPLKAAYNAAHPEGAGFTVAIGRTGNEVFQTVVNAIGINAWDLIVIDSVAVAISEWHLEKKEVGDALPGGEAGMVNQLCARAQTEFNGVEAYNGRVIAKHYVCKTCLQQFGSQKDHTTCEALDQQAHEEWVAATAKAQEQAEKTGKKAKAVKPPAKRKPQFEESVAYGTPPRTALGVVNQLRAQGIGSNSMQPIPDDANGGKGLKHGKKLDLNFFGRVKLQAQTDGFNEVYGSIYQVQATKSQVGIPERTGVVEHWSATVPGISIAGRYNLMTDLVGAKISFGKDNEKTYDGLAIRAGIIKQNGGWYYLGEEKFNGTNALQKYLSENPHVVHAVNSQLSRWVKDGHL